MAMMAYMWAKGQKSGAIEGSVIQKGKEKSIAVIAATHQIETPRDPQSGLPTGQRMHKPFVITKELDKSTPTLYQILCTNENLSEVTIKFYTPQIKAQTGVGSEVNHFTVKLTNANIAYINSEMCNIRDPELVKYPEYEEVSLVYQKIEWTWNDGGIMATDDWLDRPTS